MLVNTFWLDFTENEEYGSKNEKSIEIALFAEELHHGQCAHGCESYSGQIGPHQGGGQKPLGVSKHSDQELRPPVAEPGQVAHAKITSIVPYGAFARLEEGLDGLIHISELPKEDENGNSLEMLYEGQEVDVRVVNVDASKQRLGLSLHLSV